MTKEEEYVEHKVVFNRCRKMIDYMEGLDEKDNDNIKEVVDMLEELYMSVYFSKIEQ